jgi:hypothetical protein
MKRTECRIRLETVSVNIAQVFSLPANVYTFLNMDELERKYLSALVFFFTGRYMAHVFWYLYALAQTRNRCHFKRKLNTACHKR